MALVVCGRCTTRYALGLSYCPNCTSTDHHIEGEEKNVAKITRAGGPSYSEAEALERAEQSAAAQDELAPSAPAPASDLNPADEVGQDSTPAPDTDGEDYGVLSVVELRQLLRDRNDDRDEDDQLPLSGNKAELVKRLVDDDKHQDDGDDGEHLVAAGEHLVAAGEDEGHHG